MSSEEYEDSGMAYDDWKAAQEIEAMERHDREVAENGGKCEDPKCYHHYKGKPDSDLPF